MSETENPGPKDDYRRMIVAEIKRDLPLFVLMLIAFTLSVFTDVASAQTTGHKTWWYLATFDACAALALASFLRFYVKHRPKVPLIEERAADDFAVRRRMLNKRWNERMKLLASGLNSIGGAALLALTVVPVVLNHQAISHSVYIGLASAIGLHICGQVALTFSRTEE